MQIHKNIYATSTNHAAIRWPSRYATTTTNISAVWWRHTFLVRSILMVRRTRLLCITSSAKSCWNTGSALSWSMVVICAALLKCYNTKMMWSWFQATEHWLLASCWRRAHFNSWVNQTAKDSEYIDSRRQSQSDAHRQNSKSAEPCARVRGRPWRTHCSFLHNAQSRRHDFLWALGCSSSPTNIYYVRVDKILNKQQRMVRFSERWARRIQWLRPFASRALMTRASTCLLRRTTFCWFRPLSCSSRTTIRVLIAGEIPFIHTLEPTSTIYTFATRIKRKRSFQPLRWFFAKWLDKPK